MSNTVVSSHLGDCLLLTLDNPPVNALTREILEQLAAAISEAAKQDAIQAIILTGAGKAFVGGADIRAFPKIVAGELPPIEWQSLVNAVEDSPKPIIAAINGAALGGGLELAMACHWRVAARTAALGQPEVKLGLIPGAGGTQRLPRLAGTELALKMIAFGDPLTAEEALHAGIVDQLVDGDLVQAVIAMVASGAAVRRTRELTSKLLSPAEAESLAALFLDQCRKRMPSQTAPLAGIECVAATSRLPFPEGLAYENRRFEECLYGSQSQALIHIFFAERAAGKLEASRLSPVQRAAVAGAGMMGSGIAMCFANAGIPVLLTDTSATHLERALETIRKNYEATARKGRLTQADVEARLALIQTVPDFEGFETADLVVEAVYEELSLKQRLFLDLDRIARPGAILATNTSTLNIDAIAAVTRRPESVAGMHFFSPANVMRLLEVVKGRASAPETLATLLDTGRRLKKVCVLSGNCFGFIGNRMYAPYRAQAVSLIERGCSVQQVDAAITSWGFAMGPLAVGDLVGLDVYWLIRQAALQAGLPHTPVTTFEDELYKLGRYGQKTRSGWYLYDDARRPSPDPEVERLVREYASWQGIEQRQWNEREIRERCLLALINEGGRLLEEGIAEKPSDIDIVLVHGFGFPAWRGGPMHYAESLGLDNVRRRLDALYDEEGPQWKPALWR
ncbi:MAG: enoyl-CoA hydratase/isomerase family protein [Acidobacteria bacterium]|nr:enoyl-CoA hydratase/isomerase family protein [Acidobacteriota bacterium]